MAFEVNFSAEAEDDLFAIYVYVAEASGIERADGFDRRLRAACLKLANFPNRGTPQEEMAAGLRSIAFERRATIYYRVGEAVEIVRVIYAGRDAQRAFGSE